MSGLCSYNPIWEQARAQGGEGRVYEDGDILIASDFEGGNGSHIRRAGLDAYVVTLEPEPGQHRFSGASYYYCFGMQNLRPDPRRIKVRLEARAPGNESFGQGVRHAVLRRAGKWSQLDPASLRPVEGEADTLELHLSLPGAAEPDPVLFVSDFHWWPYSEMVAYLGTLRGVEIREIGRSFQNRAIYAVEIGRAGAPCIVSAQTPQPSEMGSLACRAMLDFLCSHNPEAADIRERFRTCFVPMSNPDGTVLGYGVSDGQGRFPYFEGDLAAAGDPDATPEMATLWRYLNEQRPWLFWDWHSNNWDRRPGHQLLRYTHDLLGDDRKRALWDDLEERLLALPDTHHESWTSRTEGLFQRSLSFAAITHLGAISCMIKQHDKYPLARSSEHAVACLRTAAAL